MTQYVIVLKPVVPEDDSWEARPTNLQEVADYVEKSLAHGGPDVEVYNYFEQDD